MPLWCSSADRVSSSQSVPTPHHRIVRIPPGECVVLNSAERAPYLLVIEILHNDLDFDPSNRHNKSTLQRIVAKESEKKGASRDLIPFPSTSSSQDKPSIQVNVSDAFLGKDTPEMEGEAFAPISAINTVVPAPLAQTEGEEEEIDLVEQLYGDEKLLRSRPLDLSDSVVLRPTPKKNKDLDLAAWSRSSSQPTTPSFEQNGAALGSDYQRSNSRSSTPQPIALSHSGQSQNLTLEDYSERMRTAAVMLSQLNASLVWEPVSPAPGTQERTPITPAGPSKGLSGSSWFTVVAPHSQTAREGGPLHPSLAGVSQEQTTSQPQRMKLQPSEAAAIRDRIMNEMLALEEERMQRMRENRDDHSALRIGMAMTNTMEDEGIIRRELNKVDSSAVVFSESWAAKKSRVRQESPYGHLGMCVSCHPLPDSDAAPNKPIGTVYRLLSKPVAISAKSNLLFSLSKSSSVYGKRKTANVGRDSMLFLFCFPCGGGSDFSRAFASLSQGVLLVLLKPSRMRCQYTQLRRQNTHDVWQMVD